MLENHRNDRAFVSRFSPNIKVYLLSHYPDYLKPLNEASLIQGATIARFNARSVYIAGWLNTLLARSMG